MTEPGVAETPEETEAFDLIACLTEEFHDVPLSVGYWVSYTNGNAQRRVRILSRDVSGAHRKLYEVARRGDGGWRRMTNTHLVYTFSDIQGYLRRFCSRPKDPLERLAEVKTMT